MEPDGPAEWHIAAELPGDEQFPEDDEDPWTDEDALPAAPVAGGRRGRGSPWVMAAVAIAAAAAGAAIGLTVTRWPAAASAVPPPASSSSAPAGSGTSGGGNGGLPTLSPLSGNGALEMQVVGSVTAVSRTSITIGGDGASVTAAFGHSTKFAGVVRSPAGIKVGDEVAATLTGVPGSLTVVSCQDPAGPG